MKNYLALAHASVLVRDTATALGFYCGVLDMPLDAARPDLGYPGAWLNLGAQQIHLLELPNPDPATGRPAHGGRDRHIAVLVPRSPRPPPTPADRPPAVPAGVRCSAAIRTAMPWSLSRRRDAYRCRHRLFSPAPGRLVRAVQVPELFHIKVHIRNC